MIQSKKIFLAEDDADDRAFFEDALNDLQLQTELTISEDGAQLMTALEETVPPIPYVIFIDLNMPRKNGFECLKEIRESNKLKNIPVVVLSTSDHENIIDSTYSMGANLYIRKPSSYQMLKKAIEMVLASDFVIGGQTSKEKYYLEVK
jgi:CheY-like chemotaxis protein